MADIEKKPHLIIKIGTDWKQTFQLIDADTGGPADLRSTVVTMRGSIRDKYNGTRLARFKNAGGWDGTITGDIAGNLSVELPVAFTTSMPVTPRFVFDIEVVHIATNKTYRPIEGTGSITPEVTTDA